jgi:hypothetical protein
VLLDRISDLLREEGRLNVAEVAARVGWERQRGRLTSHLRRSDLFHLQREARAESGFTVALHGSAAPATHNADDAQARSLLAQLPPHEPVEMSLLRFEKQTFRHATLRGFVSAHPELFVMVRLADGLVAVRRTRPGDVAGAIRDTLAAAVARVEAVLAEHGGAMATHELAVKAAWGQRKKLSRALRDRPELFREEELDGVGMAFRLVSASVAEQRVTVGTGPADDASEKEWQRDANETARRLRHVLPEHGGLASETLGLIVGWPVSRGCIHEFLAKRPTQFTLAGFMWRRAAAVDESAMREERAAALEEVAALLRQCDEGYVAAVQDVGLAVGWTAAHGRLSKHVGSRPDLFDVTMSGRQYYVCLTANGYHGGVAADEGAGAAAAAPSAPDEVLLVVDDAAAERAASAIRGADEVLLPVLARQPRGTMYLSALARLVEPIWRDFGGTVEAYVRRFDGVLFRVGTPLLGEYCEVSAMRQPCEAAAFVAAAVLPFVPSSPECVSVEALEHALRWRRRYREQYGELSALLEQHAAVAVTTEVVFGRTVAHRVEAATASSPSWLSVDAHPAALLALARHVYTPLLTATQWRWAASTIPLAQLRAADSTTSALVTAGLLAQFTASWTVQESRAGIGLAVGTEPELLQWIERIVVSRVLPALADGSWHDLDMLADRISMPTAPPGGCAPPSLLDALMALQLSQRHHHDAGTASIDVCLVRRAVRRVIAITDSCIYGPHELLLAASGASGPPQWRGELMCDRFKEAVSPVATATAETQLAIDDLFAASVLPIVPTVPTCAAAFAYAARLAKLGNAMSVGGAAGDEDGAPRRTSLLVLRALAARQPHARLRWLRSGGRWLVWRDAASHQPADEPARRQRRVVKTQLPMH